jgi:hypothetical protein
VKGTLAPAAQTWSEERESEEDSSGSHWGLGAGFQPRQQPYDGIDSVIEDSPLVDGSTQSSAVLGYVYVQVARFDPTVAGGGMAASLMRW